jgi:hypothetical protein
MVKLKKGLLTGGRVYGLTGALVLAALILSLAWPGAALAGRWSPTDHMGTARAEHTATLLPNGKVLVAGGVGASGNIIDSAELYTPGQPTAAVDLLLDQ